MATPQDELATEGVWTIVVAAGSGSRYGADKLAEPLSSSATVLDVTVAQAQAMSAGVVVVVAEGDTRISSSGAARPMFVAGGASRSASVRNGLAALPASAEIVLVHDGARPLADDALYARVIDAIRDGATVVVPGIAVNDTMRTIDGAPVDRDQLRAVQTPQAFRFGVLSQAHAGGADATDDATLAEAIGAEVVVVDGDVRNLKITRPADLAVARSLLDDT